MAWVRLAVTESDTLGEVTVIFTGGIGVIALLRRRWRSDREEEEE